MAFDPRFGPGPEQNRFVYLFYTAAPNSGFRLRSTISRFTANAALTAVDTGSEVRLIGLDKLESNHNGGHLVFGPDGLLYAGFGEGGGEPNPEAQDDRYLFGKIIRINPSVASGRLPYTIPAGQPECGQFSLQCHRPWHGSVPRGVGARPAQPVAIQLRQGHRSAVGGRRRVGTIRGSRHRDQGSELRLADHRRGRSASPRAAAGRG